jgi:transcription elongation factor GreA
MIRKMPITVFGEKILNEELKILKTVKRPKVISDIAEARAHGDLKENAEYHAAREQQGFIEGRISDIESKLSNATVVDIKKLPKGTKVIFGATVSLVNTETEKEVKYQLVGIDEADIKSGKISINSPLARAMIGKEEDDVVEVITPNGIIEYEILEVKYI